MDSLLLIILFCLNTIALVFIFVLLINRRLKERKQKLEEEKYKSLFSKSSDAIMLFKNGLVEEVNEQLLLLFEYEEQEVVGQNSINLSPEKQKGGVLSKELGLEKRTAALQGDPQLFNWKYKKKDGTLFDAEVSLSGFVYEDDEFVQVIVRNTTERTENERKLKESEEQYRLLFENNPLPMWISERKSLRFVNINNAAIKHYGYSREEFLNMSLLDIRPAENKVEMIDFLSHKGESGAASNIYFSGVWKHIRKDGSIIDVEVNRGKMLVNNNQFNLSIINDITDKKRVEKSLKKSEESFRMLAENAADIVFRIEQMSSPVFSYLSPAVTELTGYSPQDFYNDTQLVFKLIQEADKKSILKIAQDTEGQQRFIEDQDRTPTITEVSRKDGVVIWLETVVRFIYNEKNEWIAVEGISRDITERRRLEKKLEDSEQSYKTLFENSPDGVFLHIDGKIIFANPTGLEMLAIKDLEEIESETLFNFLLPEYHEAVKSRMVRVKAGEVADFEEYTVINKKGKRIELEAKSIPVLYRGKQAVQLVVHNLTEKKYVERERLRAQIVEESNVILHKEVAERIKAQRDLQESEKYIKNIVNSSLDMIIASDEMGRITEFNNAAQITFGYSSREVIGRKFDFLYASYAEFEKVSAQINKNGLYTGETLNKKKNGEHFTSFLTASKIYSEDALVLGYVGVSRDITEVHKAQEKLRQSEELYRDLFENTTELIHSVDANGEILYVNTMWKEALGYGEEEVKNKNILHFVHPQSTDRYRDAMNQVFQGQKINNLDIDFLTKDSKVILLEGNLSFKKSKEGKIVAIRGIFRDITERRRAEQTIKLSEERYRAIYDQSFLGISRIDLSGKYIQANLQMCNILGYTEKEMIAKTIYDVSFEEDIESLAKSMKELVSGEIKNITTERNHKRKDGSTVYCNLTRSIITNAGGEPEYIVSICEDITERKKTQKKINDQAAKINAIFDSSSHLIWSVDRNISLTSFNRNYSDALFNLYGKTPQIPENKKEPKIKFAPEEYHDFWNKKYEEAFRGIPQQFETRQYDKNNKLVVREIFLNPIYKDEGIIEEISGIAHDITEKKLAEEQMKESLQEKEVLLKEVHHRVKNNLQVISSIMNLQSSYIKDKYALEMLRELQNRIKSMSFIHESLYQTTAFASVKFSEYIVTLTKNLIHSYRIYSGLIELHHDVKEVFLNLDTSIPCGLIVNELVSNALKYAFPDGKKGAVWVRLNEINNTVTLTVSDNGIGLPEKLDFRNTESLGLQLVTSLVEQINGEILCENKIGTKFTVTFKSDLSKKVNDVKN